MKKFISIFGIIMVVIFANFLETEKVLAENNCELIAPRSCYYVQTSNLEKWQTGTSDSNRDNENKFLYCDNSLTDAKDKPHNLDFREFSRDASEICQQLKTKKDYGNSTLDCSKIVSVQDVQNIIKPFIEAHKSEIWTNQSALSSSNFSTYKINNNSKPLPNTNWVSSILDCQSESNNFLNDGKYGSCTQYALQLYLDQNCLLNIPEPPDLTGENLIVLGGSKFDPTNLDFPNNSNNSGTYENSEWGHDYSNPNGTLSTCSEKFTMVFSSSGNLLDKSKLSSYPYLSTKKIKTCADLVKLGLTDNDCSLKEIAKKLEISIDLTEKNNNYPKLKKAISEKICPPIPFECTEDPNIKIPPVSKTSATANSYQNFWAYLLFSPIYAQNNSAEEYNIFDRPEYKYLCEKLGLKDDCNAETVQNKIRGSNFHKSTNAYFTNNTETSNRPTECDNNKNLDNKIYDKCTQYALQSYALAEFCQECPPEKIAEAHNLPPELAKKWVLAGEPSYCECENEEKIRDLNTGSCSGGWDNENLRIKYQTGANWDILGSSANRYRGDASDITYWLQKFGGKITTFVASLAVLFIIYNGVILAGVGGFDSDKATKAKTGIKWALISLIIIYFAYIIVKTIISLLY